VSDPAPVIVGDLPQVGLTRITFGSGTTAADLAAALAALGDRPLAGAEVRRTAEGDGFSADLFVAAPDTADVALAAPGEPEDP
jgi:hypothetical protein